MKKSFIAGDFIPFLSPLGIAAIVAPAPNITEAQAELYLAQAEKYRMEAKEA